MRSEELVKLYVDGFPKDGIFYARYFVEKANEDNVVILRENDDIVSVAYIVDKLAFLEGKKFPICYLSAVSTLTEKRGRGLVANVIKNAVSKISQRGIPFVVLYPFDFNYYKKYGFITASYCGNAQILGGYPHKHHIATVEDIPNLIEIYNSYVEQFNFYQIVDRQYFIDLFSELAVDGGKIFISDTNEFFVVVEGGEITRYAYKNRDIFTHFNELANMSFSDFLQKDKPYIQMRIASFEDFLSLNIYENDGRFTFNISDDLVKDNDGSYVVTKIGNDISVKKSTKSDNERSIISIFNDFLEGKFPFKKQRIMFMDKY